MSSKAIGDCTLVSRTLLRYDHGDGTFKYYEMVEIDYFDGFADVRYVGYNWGPGPCGARDWSSGQTQLDAAYVGAAARKSADRKVKAKQAKGYYLEHNYAYSTTLPQKAAGMVRARAGSAPATSGRSRIVVNAANLINTSLSGSVPAPSVLPPVTDMTAGRVELDNLSGQVTLLARRILGPDVKGGELLKGIATLREVLEKAQTLVDTTSASLETVLAIAPSRLA